MCELYYKLPVDLDQFSIFDDDFDNPFMKIDSHEPKELAPNLKYFPKIFSNFKTINEMIEKRKGLYEQILELNEEENECINEQINENQSPLTEEQAKSIHGYFVGKSKELSDEIQQKIDPQITKSLEKISKYFGEKIHGNIDSFIQENDIIGNLFYLLKIANERPANTGNLIYFLNIIALIAKNSPCIYEYIDKKDNIELLVDLMSSPDLLFRVVTIFLYSINGAPQIIENLILNKNVIPILVKKIFLFINNKFISPIFTFISILFDSVSIDGFEITKKNFDGPKSDEDVYFKGIYIKNQYFERDEKTTKVVLGIYRELLSLINTIGTINVVDLIKNRMVINNSNVYYMLKIIEKYIDCFISSDNFNEFFTPKVASVVNMFYMMPLFYDHTGKIFRQVLAIFNKILSIYPSYFIPGRNTIVPFDYYFDRNDQFQDRFLVDRYIDILFKHIKEFPSLRLDLLFLLSNVTKIQQASDYILTNNLISKTNFIKLMKKFNFVEKENALIALLAILGYFPERLYEQINDLDLFQDFIDLAAEIAESTSVKYYVFMFLSVVKRVYSQFFSFTEDYIDGESIKDCLLTLNSSSDNSIARNAQLLLDNYFKDSE